MNKKFNELMKEYNSQTISENEGQFEEAHCCCGLDSGDCCDICALASCSVCCDTICTGR